MASFDSASKRLVQQNPRDFVTFCFNLRRMTGVEFTDVELITPEQPTVEMHQADVLIKVKLRGKYVLVHFEFQTTDSFDPPMALRMASYILWLVRTYRMDVYANVIYLRPDAGRNDPGKFQQQIPGNEILVEYQVIRLANMDGQAVLDAQPTGLLPFTPLMKPPVGVDADEWLHRCIQTADNIDAPNKLDTLGVMAVLGNVIFEKERILEIVRRLTMHEIPIVQYWTEQATAEARREKSRANILEVLELRLHPDATRDFQSTLDTVDDAQGLDELLRAAVLADSVEDFQRVLDAVRK